MKKIVLRDIIEEKAPSILNKYPKFLTNGILNFLNSALHIEDINYILEKHNDKVGFDFIDYLFEELNFSYLVSGRDRMRIPSEGKLMIVSNHPLGGLDGLALLRAVGEIRKDVKIVANDLLMNLTNLSNLFLPYDIYSKKSQKRNIINIKSAFENEEAVIFFPAGIVSRLGIRGIKDKKWQQGAAKFATKFETPVLPAFVDARNSLLFYIMSLVYHRFGMFLLPHELFGKKNSDIRIKFGDVIPSLNVKTEIAGNELTAHLKNHVYSIGRNETGIFETEKTIINPVSIKTIREELNNSLLLGYTNDAKKIYLVDYEHSKNVLTEISRLREHTFRSVGEGTGRMRDLDVYDYYYKHMVLWDDDSLDIVGSYRLGLTSDIIKKHGKAGLYNSAQFDLNPSFDPILHDSIEVGRSFIQKKYWRSNALDYIWQGIGAYLNKNPQIKYLYGAVSISNSYPEIAKSLIVYYYSKWYQEDSKYADAKIKYIIPVEHMEFIEKTFLGKNHLEDFRKMKLALRDMGVTVPVLYRKYNDLTEYGGSGFVDFCVHPRFNNAIDGLILVNMQKLKEDVKKRYYSQKSFVNKED
jgi:putative hemolysin